MNLDPKNSGPKDMMAGSAAAGEMLDAARIEGYHAHVYYTPDSRPVAERLREAIGSSFAVQLGRWHDRPIGPHPVSMYLVAFPTEQFQRLVSWLMLNRSGLSILVHPSTGDDYEDHARFALWLGPALTLNLEALRRAEPKA